ncbi:FAD:protein FMN transferase [hydrothermal vent metagenome]|uniref:FAD:protein FMN transferase n=1 Tax=hydrothermal vent metagenome TaxID=652676 RepID=A0A3B1AI76_9ZZZZ
MLFRLTFLFFIFCGYSQPLLADWYKQYWDIMGTRAGVELWHKDKRTAQKAIKAVQAEMRRIDKSMSPFIQSSEVSVINRQAAEHPVKISRELFKLILKAQTLSKKSKGVFDITFASVGYLYNYREHRRPTDKVIQNKLTKINYTQIRLSPKTSEIYFKQKGMRIDLGGIAKGYAVDRSIQQIASLGIRNAMVMAGGDSRLLGDKRGKPWITGIRHPRQKGKYVVVLPLENTAISTSGDYERFFIEDNVRYHHIIQPKTGKPATANQSVTVLGPDATTTDALSTTLFILPTQKALNLVNSLPQYDAIIIDKQGVLHFSSGLEQPTTN